MTLVAKGNRTQGMRAVSISKQNGALGPAGIAKRTAVRRSVLAAIFLTTFKFVVGWQTGSLGILSEATNSSLDVLAAALIYATVWIADKPADANHPYGHEKAENFAAFLQTGLV